MWTSRSTPWPRASESDIPPRTTQLIDFRV
jgi:hypothetical protein